MDFEDDVIEDCLRLSLRGVLTKTGGGVASRIVGGVLEVVGGAWPGDGGGDVTPERVPRSSFAGGPGGREGRSEGVRV